MPELTLDDIPQQELDALTARAERHGRTLEEEARHVLHEAAAEQLLVMELERVTEAADERLERTTAARPASSQARGASRPRRRVKYEPTPRHG
jgi:plasmid stability protein